MRGTRHRSNFRRLAVFPAAALAAVAFAAPALAEDEAPPPVVPVIVDVDPSVVGPVDESSQGDAAPAAPAVGVAEPEEAGGAAETPEISEIPANVPSSGWVLVEPAQQSSAPRPQAAVISPAERTPPVSRAPAAEPKLRQASPTKSEGRYQSLRSQYRHVSDAVRRVKAAAPPLRELASLPAFERRGSIVSTNATITAPNDRGNCADERIPGVPICLGDVGDKSIWNCRWIPDCAADGSPTEAPVDAPECDGAQYQPEDEQYQSEPEDPDRESIDDDVIDSDEDDPASGSCDGSAVPGPSVQPPSGLDPGVTPPAAPAPSSTPPAVGPQSLTGTEPSAPPPEAVPVGEDSVAVGEDSVAETARPRGDISRSSEQAPTDTMPDAGGVGALATEHEAQRRSDVRPRPVRSRQRVKVTHRPTVSGPRVDLLASPEPTSSRATSGTSVWVLVFAMLLFALALFGLSYASLTGPPEQVLLARLGSRLRSKGLSRSSTGPARTRPDRSREESTGIRYRD